MQEENESRVKKVNKKVSNAKMSKNQKAPQNQQNISESPQNVRLDTSESDEESVSEESFPQDNDDISTEEFPEDEESCESENDQEEDVSDEDSEEENTDDDSDATADEAHQSGPAKKFLLNIDDDQQMSKQTRIESILEAAAASKDKRGNPVLRNATAALDEAAQTITRMRSDASPRDKNLLSRTLIAACTDNDVNAVRRLLVEGNNLNDTDDGDSLLSLACSAGYYELAQVLLAMSAQVEDRGQKNDCTPLMEAASAGHVEIIELLIRHGADVNAQSSTGNTPLMYACAGGHVEAVKVLLAHGANVEDHNENGHTPLMESASAGHVEVAKILLDHGAGINTHSNEFKESALTLACYKGHLDMVRFLLEAGADQEHKTDEMHTALMEASMDGHVEVARLLLDSGAQVNMPTDSFESPLTLAACGGHVDLAMLLIERGANIEEVNDEGYTPLMEAAREGHEEMVSLLLTQGANINAQTEETQETALTLACCGGFLEVADYLIKHGADIELGASTPLMEAAQEGHLELVKFLLENRADVHAQTQTGDTALTYACENGHTDVAEILLHYGAELEHLSEGGRTPLMKACRAGHICTVKFLIQKGADVNRQTTNNDHTPLSLACAGGHQQVVELLLAHGADPYHKLKDNSTMLIEAAKGGHTGVVQLLLDYPTSIPPPQQQSVYIPATMPHQTSQMNITQIKQQQLKILQQQQQQQQQQQFMVTPPGLHEVTEVIRLQDPPGMFQSQTEMIQNQNYIIDQNLMSQVSDSSMLSQMKLLQSTGFKDGLAYGLTKGQNAVSSIINQQNGNNINVVTCNNQQPPLITNNLCMSSSSSASSSTNKQKNISRKKCSSGSYNDMQPTGTVEVRSTTNEEENVSYIKSSLDKLDNTLQKNIQFIHDSGPPSTLLPSGTYVDITTAAQGKNINLTSNNQLQNTSTTINKPTQLATKSEVSQATAISDRPKVKAKNSRKSQQQQQQQNQQSQSGKLATTLTASKIEQDIADQVNLKSNATIVPQTIQEASLTSYQPTLVIDDIKDNKNSTFEKNHAYSLVDFEAFQKMPLNNLSNRSAHWDPKVFRKIAQLIDPPKTPNETPPQSHNNSRPNSPEEKKLENEFKSLIEEAMHNGIRDNNDELMHVEGLEKTLTSIHQLNPEEFSGCGNAYPSLEAIESFNTEDVAAISTDDATGPIYNYEWVDEIMQTLNVSPDISNAFHEIAANINNQDLEQYANFFGLNSICKSKWSTPHWPSHQITSQSTSPTNEQEENLIIHNEGDHMDGKQDDQNLLMIDQTGYTPQFTVEQLQLLSQLQQQHPLLQIDPQTAQNILMPSGTGFQMSPSNIMTGQQKGVPDTQQTKFVFNVDGEKTSQSLQLLFQLPNDSQQQQNQQLQQPSVTMKTPNLNQKVQQNVAQTQTMPINASTAQPIQLPQMLNHQQSFLNFQLQQQHQNLQPDIQNAISNMQQQQQQQQQQQKIQPIMNKANYQQVATQTQIVGTQTQSHAHSIDIQPHPTQTVSKTTNAQSSVCGKKPNISNDQKRKEKSRYALRQAASNQNQFQYDQQLQYANIPSTTGVTDRSIEIDSETDSNHDTALTLACAGGHEELVELLLSRKANIEHRDKKGFTPLILAATAGHEKVVETLINNGADLEAQSERTKDTPLSLACSGGRYEVVELLLRFGANKEHRNVSDYTPLSLAASGGYVNIIKLLLNHGAEINSRTGSKLGISPLMLAAMNGHTAAVRLLLDMGSDINAQIETNRNTALTLACFQGRHEVVSLLLDRKANVEHRAKTGLTPLMEAASGGYIEVGRVLLDKGADVNAAPVPSSRDTALTIAADKGHLKFVELLLARGAAVEVKNKKGNSPLWLAANGGHLGVVEALYHAKADIDSQDNRKVSCLMAAFRKGHVKVVKWMVNHVSQFPSDQEMTRYITVVDKEVVDKCHECVKIIRAAKETQAAKANINASILLKELDMEKSREDARKAAAAKRRERKKRRKQEKREAQRKANGETNVQAKNNSSNQKNKNNNKQEESEDESEEIDSNDEDNENDLVPDKEEGGDSGIDQGSCSSTEAKANILATHQEVPEEQPPKNAQKNKNRKKNQQETPKVNNNTNNNNNNISTTTVNSSKISNRSISPLPTTSTKISETPNKILSREIETKKNRDQKNQQQKITESENKNLKPIEKENVPINKARDNKNAENIRNHHKKSLVFGNSRSSDDYDVDFSKSSTFTQSSLKTNKSTTSPSKPATTSSSTTYSNISASKSQFKGDDEWKEVGRKPTTTPNVAPSNPSANEIGYKKIQVPLNAISRVIGRQGSNINAIRAATGAHIEVEKQGKTQGDRSITIKGVPEATKQAHNLISALVKDPDADILSMLPRNNFQPVRSSSSTNIISPSSTAAINNGTSVWEKSLNTIPTVTNPVKPASYAAPLKTATPPTTTSGKSITPTQLTKSNQRSVAKNLFTGSNIIRPTPTSNAKILMQDGAKKGIIATNGPPSKPANSSNSQSSTSGTFASKLNSTGDMTMASEKKNMSQINQSPMKQIFTSSNVSTSLPNPFSNTSNVSTESNLQLQQAQPIASSNTSNMTRSITPIGPPTRNSNASPHTSHIVNTLDLSTPYNNPISSSHPVGNDLTTQIQSKLGELHVSAQGLEYSLFDNCKTWSQEQSVAFNEQLSATFIEPPAPIIFDASKAPGYRGNASINSPVSSKTSSNSATPPSTVLATQAPTNASNNVSQSSGAYGDMNSIKPIGSGMQQQQQQQPIGPVQRPNMMNNTSRIDSSVSNVYGRSSGTMFDRYMPNESSYGSMNFMNPASMSRLNPKASAFSTSNLQNKMNSNQYDTASASTANTNTNNNNGNSNNNNYMKSQTSNMSGHQNYHRTSMNNQPSRWLGDLGHSFVGQTMDYMAAGSSPNMSPNNNNNNNNNTINGPNATNVIDDSRKAPRPIGTERHNLKYNCFQYPMNQAPPPNNVMDLDSQMLGQIGPNSWLDKNQHQWQAPSNVAVIRNPYETTADYMMPDLFQQQYTMDQQMGYTRNGAQGPNNHPYHTNVYMNDLSNLTTNDLQQSSYEKQQPWTAKWTH